MEKGLMWIKVRAAMKSAMTTEAIACAYFSKLVQLDMMQVMMQFD